MAGKILNQIYRVAPDQYTATYPPFDSNHTAMTDWRDELGARVADEYNNLYTVVKAGEALTDGDIVALKDHTTTTVALSTCESETINGTTYYYNIYLAATLTAGAAADQLLHWDTDGATVDSTYKGQTRKIISNGVNLCKISTKNYETNKYDGNALTTAPTNSAAVRIIYPWIAVKCDTNLTQGAVPIGVCVGACASGSYGLIMVRGYYPVNVGNCQTNALAAMEAIQATAVAGRGDGASTPTYSVGRALYAYNDNGTGQVMAYINPDIL